MEYLHVLRVFATPGWCEQWYNIRPKLSTLLTCFEINRNDPLAVRPVSVYGAQNYLDELQNVAALVQKGTNKATKRFGIRVTCADCREAGIAIEPGRGETGIDIVDLRHADLKGDLASFIKLSTIITQKIWEGEERICIFSPHAILGEVAILSRLESGIDEEAIDRCNKTLLKSPNYFRFPAGQHVVELLSTMDDDEHIQIVGHRSLGRESVDDPLDASVPATPTRSFLRRIMLRILGSSSP